MSIRHVLVTGGAKGIGAGCARVFCREGGLIAILDRDAVAGAATAEALSAESPGVAKFWLCDVSRHQELHAMIQDVVATWGDRTQSSHVR